MVCSFLAGYAFTKGKQPKLNPTIKKLNQKSIKFVIDLNSVPPPLVA